MTDLMSVITRIQKCDMICNSFGFNREIIARMNEFYDYYHYFRVN